jgi:outer membrane protein assembly factor BamB
VARLPAGRRPNSVVLAGGRVWVGERFRARLLAYDAADPGHASRVAIPSGVAELAASENDVWAALWRGRAVARVDAITGRVTGAPIALPDEPSALEAADGGLWVGLVASVREGPGTVLALDSASGATRWSAVLPGQADRLVRAGGALWALLSSPNQLLRLDPDTGVVEETIKLPGQHASDLASGSGKLWVSVREGDWLVRIDSRTGRRAAAPLAHSPAGLAVHGNTVAVAMYGASVLAGFDAGSLRHRGDVRVPLNPYMVALDDGGAWVVCAGAGRLVRIRATAVARTR